jgi:hypothetical protein
MKGLPSDYHRDLPPLQPDLVQGFMSWNLLNPAPVARPEDRRRSFYRKRPLIDPFT